MNRKISAALKGIVPDIIRLSNGSTLQNLHLKARSALLQLCSCEDNLFLCKDLGGFPLLVSLFKNTKTDSEKEQVLEVCHSMSLQCDKVNLFDIYTTIVDTVVEFMSEYDEHLVEKALKCLKQLCMRIDL
jgi:hypothetical protein